MEYSDDDSFAWTPVSSNASSYSSEESDVGIMARDDIHKTKSRKHESSLSCDNTRESTERELKRTKKSKIKEEPPEEKVDIKSIRIKKESESHESEHNLEAEVRREQESHRHQRHGDGEETDDYPVPSKQEDQELSSSYKKKSKKKKRQSSVVISDINSDNKETPYDQTNGDLSPSEDVANGSSIKFEKKSKIKDHNGSINEDLSMSIEENDYYSNINDSDKSSQKLKKKKSKHNQDARKISDRIRFEDDDDDNIESGSGDTTDTTPPQLRRFLQHRPELSYSTLQGELLITKDDDLFLLKCPEEVDINLLQHKDLILEQKCKIKVDGHSYDGSLEKQSCRIAVLSVGRNKPNVVNLPLSGIVNFRKRIPKAHYVQDSVMVNNQTNFIPLPDTKCRHPLFGADYKKAIKISSAIKALLNTKVESESFTEPKKKKKRKKSKDVSQIPTEEDEPVPTKTEPSEHRKRKRHDETDHDVPRKKKKTKRDADSPVAWESEKAIEKNLFDF